MIRDLSIASYRGVQSGGVSNLASLSVLVGPNNSGKSTVLEALLITGSGGHGEAGKQAIERRGWIGEESLTAAFPTGKAVFRATDSAGVQAVLSASSQRSTLSIASASSAGNVSRVRWIRDPVAIDNSVGQPLATLIELDAGTFEPSALEIAYSGVELMGQRPWLIELLRPLHPSIRDLRILLPKGRSTLYVEDARGRWPAISAGDGFKRLLLMAARIVTDSSGLILIEEPESQLHPGALSGVSKVLWEASKTKQIVITTHSLEYLDAQFLGATPEQLAQAALFRLALVEGELKAIRIPGEKVKELREEIGEDLRR